MTTKNQRKLTGKEIFRECDTSIFEFETTEEIQPSFGVMGQERALRALEFGLSITGRGYNIFVSGQKDCGKTTISKIYANKFARLMKVPDDWIVVYNFVEPNNPKMLRMASGEARGFAIEYQKIIIRLFDDIPAFFEGDEYQTERKKIMNKLSAQEDQKINKLEELASEHNIIIHKSKSGFNTVPILDGKEISPEQFDTLEKPLKSQLQNSMKVVQNEILNSLKDIHKMERESEIELEKITTKLLKKHVSIRFSHIEEKYADYEEILQFLTDIIDEICFSPDDFISDSSQEGDSAESSGEDRSLMKYTIKILVDHLSTEHAPVIHEINPTYKNLFGYIEKESAMGMITTDFTKIHAGALMRANGGILLLDAESLLSNPLAWIALKRALRSKKIILEDSPEMTGAPDLASIKPQPIPLDIKVVLIGHPTTFQLLNSYDNEFNVLFKVRSDFDNEMDYSEIAARGYGEFIARICNEGNRLHFSKGAVAHVVECGVRLTEDQTKLSLRLGPIKAIVDESSFWARQNNHSTVMREDVKKALSEKKYRASLVEEKMAKSISDGTTKIDLAGKSIGQINGLVVYQVDEHDFGKPARITARTYQGKDGIINIEREVELSGKIHDKGVLILTGFLGSCFAQKHPLSMNATITFEQSYGGIDGDSASSTELYALLSSLAEVPISQGIAVTGSIDQNGEIQAIGGVNEKIEGFFECCYSQGLTGSQGVIIPSANVKNLMLSENVRKSIEQGEFHVWAVDTVEEGIELLTGVPSGIPNKSGNYPVSSVFGKVQRKLKKFSQMLSSDN